jgi:hypothetical protein
MVIWYIFSRFGFCIKKNLATLPSRPGKTSMVPGPVMERLLPFCRSQNFGGKFKFGQFISTLLS